MFVTLNLSLYLATKALQPLNIMTYNSIFLYFPSFLVLIKPVTRQNDQLRICRRLPPRNKYCCVGSPYGVCAKHCTVFYYVVSIPLLWRLFKISYWSWMKSFQAVDEARPGQLRERLQFTISFLQRRDGNKLVLFFLNERRIVFFTAMRSGCSGKLTAGLRICGCATTAHAHTSSVGVCHSTPSIRSDRAYWSHGTPCKLIFTQDELTH